MFQVWINEVLSDILSFIFDYMISLLILKIILLTIVIAFFIILFINFIGLFYTADKNISITNSYFHSADELYKTISDISNYPEWKKEIINVETNGESWKEYFTTVDALKYKILQADPGKRIIISLESEKFPLNLTRKYTIWHQDYMSFLKIEDNLSIKKPYLRVFSSIFYNHTDYLRTILQSIDFYLDNKSKNSTSPFL